MGIGGVPVNATVDAFGNLVTNPETGTGAGVVTATYDAANRLTALDGPGTTHDAAYTFDALGRHATRDADPGSAGGVDTFTYLGTSETVAGVTGTAGLVRLLDPTGGSLAVRDTASGAVNWVLPDLHGNIAGGLAGTTVASALRYDGYGVVLATGSAGGTPVAPERWRYQGRMDLAPAGSATPRYDAGARDYSPGLGTFTSVDSVRGSALDPASLNRYLYAHANPATLIDPDGHAALPACNTAQYDFCHPASIPRGVEPRPSSSEPEPGLVWIRKVARTLEQQRAAAINAAWTPISLEALADLPSSDRTAYARANIARLLAGDWAVGSDAFFVAQLSVAIYNQDAAARGSSVMFGLSRTLASADVDRDAVSRAAEIWSRTDHEGGGFAWVAAANGVSLFTAAALAEIEGAGIAAAEARPGRAAIRAAHAAPNQGIYIIRRSDGMIYVGQSSNIDRRLVQHLAGRHRFTIAEVQGAERIAVPGGRVAREVAEQLKINELGQIVPGSGLLNVRNPIGAARKDLLQTFRSVHEYVDWLEYHLR